MTFTAVYDDEGDKLCHKCGEYWPPTDEFFECNSNGAFKSPCKACRVERRLEAMPHKRCKIEGCDRLVGYTNWPYCKPHGRQLAREYRQRKKEELWGHT
jgi:hypothetical protein